MLARHNAKNEVVSAVLQGDREPAAAVFALQLFATILREDSIFADAETIGAVDDEIRRAEELAGKVGGGSHEIMVGNEEILCMQGLMMLMHHNQTLMESGATSSPYGDMLDIIRHATTAQAMFDVEPGVTHQ